jgi:polyisoprenyl-teichoic acid--peptidoglycan teichoic acid transferase
MPEFLDLRLSRRKTLLAAASLAGAGALRAFSGAAQHEDQVATPAPIEVKDTYTFVVAGMDTRTVEEDENTDVLMVSRVDLANGIVRTISFPRDLYLEIPGFGLDKINRAYDYGSKPNNYDWNAGIAVVTEMLEYNFGIDIDAAVTTTFSGIAKVVDTLGGVTVDNPYDLYDAQFPTADYGYKEIFYPAGVQVLSGEQAMEFTRTRHQDGDDGRVMRQQLVLRAMLDKAQEPETLLKLPELVEAARDAVVTNIPEPVQVQLVASVSSIDPANVIFGTMTDYVWSDTTASGMWVYQGDWSVLPGYVQGFLNGEF